MTKYVFLDMETTGLDPHKGNHRIIELACIEYEDSPPIGNVFKLKLKINPEWMVKLIEIKRVYFNYCMTNERTINRNFKDLNHLHLQCD